MNTFFALISRVLLGGLLLIAGCAVRQAEPVAAEAPAVSVSYAVARSVTDFAEFTGRLAAVDSVEVRAHVWGVGSSRVDLQACKLEYSIVSPK